MKPYRMNILYWAVILVLCIYGSYCVSYDSRQEQLYCIQSCRDLYRRFCLQPPIVCGACFPNYEDSDGICKRKRLVDFTHENATMERATEIPISKKDLVINAERKEEKLTNYAVNQSANDVSQQQTTNTLVNDMLFIAVIVCVTTAAIIGLIIAIICWCKMKKSAKDSSEFEYPGYGSIEYKGNVNVEKSTGDRRLAQSAQMYHYQHQKQQMLEMEKNQNAVSKSGSEASTDEENDAGEYTVYECPGLATAGEMEVPNPLFAEPPADNLQPGIPQDTPEHPHMLNGYKEL